MKIELKVDQIRDLLYHLQDYFDETDARTEGVEELLQIRDAIFEQVTKDLPERITYEGKDYTVLSQFTKLYNNLCIDDWIEEFHCDGQPYDVFQIMPGTLFEYRMAVKAHELDDLKYKNGEV